MIVHECEACGAATLVHMNPPHTRPERSRSTGDWITVYDPPADPWLVSSATQSDAIFDFLDDLRRQTIADHEAAKAAQKAAGEARDADLARWYRGVSADAMRRLRAVRLWSGHYGVGGGDCPWIERWYWPVELAQELRWGGNGREFGRELIPDH